MGDVCFPSITRRGNSSPMPADRFDGTEPRYRFPAGFHKNQELFNLHRVAGGLSAGSRRGLRRLDES